MLAVLGDISRFEDADGAAAYFGLVPSTHQSGNHCYHGRITKQGSSHGRWMLIQAAQHVARHPGPLGVFFRRLAKKKNRNVAVVATARKLVTIAWHMLTQQRALPLCAAQNRGGQVQPLARARYRPEKENGSQRQPRSASYGSGKRTRAVPALYQIYASEQLPPLAQTAAGEQAMLIRHCVAAYAELIRRSLRVPRCSKSVSQ